MRPESQIRIVLGADGQRRLLRYLARNVGRSRTAVGCFVLVAVTLLVGPIFLLVLGDDQAAIGGWILAPIFAFLAVMGLRIGGRRETQRLSRYRALTNLQVILGPEGFTYVSDAGAYTTSWQRISKVTTYRRFHVDPWMWAYGIWEGPIGEPGEITEFPVPLAGTGVSPDHIERAVRFLAGGSVQVQKCPDIPTAD